MPIKEITVLRYKESFHWSYDYILSCAAFSLLFASAYVYRYDHWFAWSGLICGVLVFGYLGLPTF